MMRQRLLIVTHEYSLTGAPVALMNLAAGLSKAAEVLVVAPAEGPLRRHLLDRRVNAIVVPRLDTDIAMSHALMLSFDALLANTLLSFLPVHAAHRMGKPSVWYIHEGHAANTIARNHGPGVSAAFGLASRIVVPSEFSRRFFAPARAEIEVIPYGIEDRQSPPASTASGPLKVLQLGSIEPRKGQDIAAAAIRLARHLDIRLDIVGSVLLDDYHRELLASCADLPQIRFLPPVDAPQAAELIGTCDVVIVPSRDEVTPMVILEAMAMEKPVVAAAVGGIPEMIEDGKTGFLCEPQNAAQLAAILSRLAADATARRTIGAAARKFVGTHRTLEQFRDRFAKLLQELPESVN